MVKDHRGEIELPVIMLQSNEEVLEFENYDEAEKFANILEKNSNSGYKYRIKKIGESHDEHQ
jgi:hypothetical protein